MRSNIVAFGRTASAQTFVATMGVKSRVSYLKTSVAIKTKLIDFHGNSLRIVWIFVTNQNRLNLLERASVCCGLDLIDFHGKGMFTFLNSRVSHLQTSVAIRSDLIAFHGNQFIVYVFTSRQVTKTIALMYCVCVLNS